MRVLLVHPEDDISEACPAGWDWVMDFGRAPRATYERWAGTCDSKVVSIFDFAFGTTDVHALKDVLQLGFGGLVDSYGIDWWDILSVELASEIQHTFLVRRLAERLGPTCELHATREDYWFSALGQLLGIRVSARRRPTWLTGMRRCANAAISLDLSQLLQVIHDKFDPVHSVRKHFAKRPRTSGRPVILLPSAYINVSRTAVRYAEHLPDEVFLLMCARGTSCLRAVAANVRIEMLHGYFGPCDKDELFDIQQQWQRLKTSLIDASEDFRLMEMVGGLSRMPSLIRWGIAIRDAWQRVFENEDVVACLCADDSNAYSRLPLVLAEQRGIPAVACHHGALDFRMAFKTPHADFYLSKSDMERDYLQRVCKVPASHIARAGEPMAAPRIDREKSSLVFFTEPYHTWGWRTDEVYRDLLPRLVSLSRYYGIRLVLKLHPFESARQFRRMLKRDSPEASDQIAVVAGACSQELWRSIHFAVTVQSTSAMECADRGIPVFLCSWLSDPYTGYNDQLLRFGFGHGLRSPDEIGQIPRLLEETQFITARTKRVWDSVDSEKLTQLLTQRGTNAQPERMEANAR